MKFINREMELEMLAKTRQASKKSSKMTVLIGRRRIGKTRLISESLKGEPYLYFFVARKDEKLLCEEYVEQIRETLGINIFGEISRFQDIFRLLLDYAERQPLNLVVDEFQEFYRVNPAAFSEIQSAWDRKKDQTKMNLIVSGSVHSMMKKIFENSREPLFGRANERLHIKPFSVEVLKQILSEFHPDYKPEDLLSFYIFTGGVPKYVEQFADKNIFTFKAMLDEVFRENSLFLEEGKNVLIEEFGKEYTTYFSILSLLASSKTSRSEVESILQKDIGGFLSRLEKEYQIIRKVQPIFSKPGGRNIKYEIEDNFLHFWFRFIYKNKGTVEIGNFEYLKSLVKRDFPTYSGRFLEKYFMEKLALSGKWSEIGSYWERGFKNQIDIVAINRMEKTALLSEVKRKEKQYSEQQLRSKALQLQRQLGGYQLEYQGLSLKDM
ncbi:MAG: ATP-binding protein [Lewinellaceae bacterium]|nr:ATP-binding protein [Lewinellaceae bacterium]